MNLHENIIENCKFLFEIDIIEHISLSEMKKWYEH